MSLSPFKFCSADRKLYPLFVASTSTAFCPLLRSRQTPATLCGAVRTHILHFPAVEKFLYVLLGNFHYSDFLASSEFLRVMAFRY